MADEELPDDGYAEEEESDFEQDDDEFWNSEPEFDVDLPRGSNGKTLLLTAYCTIGGVELTASAEITIVEEEPDGGGVITYPHSGLVTTEDGGTDVFGIWLAYRPHANVSILISSSDTTEGTCNTLASFTPADWDIPQVITVTGVDDSDLDGDRAYYAVPGPASSGDPEYSGKVGHKVQVTNTDNEERTFDECLNAGEYTSETLVSGTCSSGEPVAGASAIGDAGITDGYSAYDKCVAWSSKIEERCELLWKIQTVDMPAVAAGEEGAQETLDADIASAATMQEEADVLNGEANALALSSQAGWVAGQSDFAGNKDYTGLYVDKVHSWSASKLCDSQGDGGSGSSNCSYLWRAMMQFPSGGSTFWRTLASGGFTPDGILYVTAKHTGAISPAPFCVMTFVLDGPD